MKISQGLNGAGVGGSEHSLSPEELGLESDGLAELGAVGAAEGEGGPAAFVPEASAGFVSSPQVEELTQRALTYLDIGYPLHLAGFAGTGKTTLAFHIAAKLGRPVILIHGDDEFASSDLTGKDVGYRKLKLIDNYIHSVLRSEENMRVLWMENRLTTACRDGYTLIYDEFNRSRPEANNVLLSVLEERMLSLPALGRVQGGYIEVHPEFRAIFTSNPEEYAGAHKTPDALLDRLITINLGHYDRDTEVKIAAAQSGIAQADAELIVDVVRKLRTVGVNNHRPTIRACIAIARILARRAARARIDDDVFRWACRDVLSAETAKVKRDGESLMPRMIDEAVRHVCGRSRKRARKAAAR
ncbi:MAG TPA: gas vesicle protein GvpN [Candidatus Binataceae bacterium]|nr:gas vesicle protein GvpN [Candidatus Binataceae bacterium]